MSADERTREAERWLRYAIEDLQAGELLLVSAGSKPRHVCRLAQQSAEKALRAVLVFEQVEFPRSHDLDALRILMPQGWQIKTLTADLSGLSELAVEARYPTESPEPTRDDAGQAVEEARTVLEGVQADFARRAISGAGESE